MTGAAIAAGTYVLAGLRGSQAPRGQAVTPGAPYACLHNINDLPTADCKLQV